MGIENARLWEQLDAYFCGKIPPPHTQLPRKQKSCHEQIRMVALSGIYAAVYELTGEVTPSCPAMTAAAIASSFDYIDCAIVGITGTDLFGKLLHDTALA